METHIVDKKNDNGFSFLEVVITVAIILTLSVGGFIVYQNIKNNAYRANVDYAVQSVYTAALIIRDDQEASAYQPGSNHAYRAAALWIETAQKDHGELANQIDLRGFMIDENQNLTDNSHDDIVIVAVSNELGYDRDGYPYFKWQSENTSLTKAEVWSLIQKQNALLDAERFVE